MASRRSEELKRVSWAPDRSEWREPERTEAERPTGVQGSDGKTAKGFWNRRVPPFCEKLAKLGEASEKLTLNGKGRGNRSGFHEYNLEVPVGVEPTHGGFADRSVSHFTTAPRKCCYPFVPKPTQESKSTASSVTSPCPLRKKPFGTLHIGSPKKSVTTRPPPL